MPIRSPSDSIGLFGRVRVVSEISRVTAELFPSRHAASDPERMARRNLCTPATPIDLIEGL
jgi:hypothetical protein